MAAFQWGPISGSTANWLNWLVAIAGMVLLVFGVVASGHGPEAAEPSESRVRALANRHGLLRTTSPFRSDWAAQGL